MILNVISRHLIVTKTGSETLSSGLGTIESNDQGAPTDTLWLANSRRLHPYRPNYRPRIRSPLSTPSVAELELKWHTDIDLLPPSPEHEKPETPDLSLGSDESGDDYASYRPHFDGACQPPLLPQRMSSLEGQSTVGTSNPVLAWLAATEDGKKMDLSRSRSPSNASSSDTGSFVTLPGIARIPAPLFCKEFTDDLRGLDVRERLRQYELQLRHLQQLSPAWWIDTRQEALIGIARRARSAACPPRRVRVPTVI